MPSEDKIKETFIKEELDIHGEYMVDLLAEAIVDKRLVKQSKLIESLDYKVENFLGFPVLKVSFYSYGRIHDLKSRNTGKPLTEDVNTNALLWGVDNKPKKSPYRAWYAKNAYGSINRLIGRLLYGYSEQERQRVIAMLKKLETLKPIEI